jgi:hypothetical protein
VREREPAFDELDARADCCTTLREELREHRGVGPSAGGV